MAISCRIYSIAEKKIFVQSTLELQKLSKVYLFVVYFFLQIPQTVAGCVYAFALECKPCMAVFLCTSFFLQHSVLNFAFR